MFVHLIFLCRRLFANFYNLKRKVKLVLITIIHLMSLISFHFSASLKSNAILHCHSERTKQKKLIWSLPLHVQQISVKTNNKCWIYKKIYCIKTDYIHSYFSYFLGALKSYFIMKCFPFMSYTKYMYMQILIQSYSITSCIIFFSQVLIFFNQIYVFGQLNFFL